jgi:IS4 transposase
MCSAPIQNFTTPEIEDLGIIGIAERAYAIVSNSMTNHEIYTNCKQSQTKYPMTIYKHDIPFKYGLLDFDREALAAMFELGYNFDPPFETHYCY